MLIQIAEGRGVSAAEVAVASGQRVPSASMMGLAGWRDERAGWPSGACAVK
jgi:hypothetical protein